MKIGIDTLGITNTRVTLIVLEEGVNFAELDFLDSPQVPEGYCI